MTARKITGVSLLAAPFVAWYIVGVVSFGWFIPTAVCLGGVALIGLFTLAFWLLLGGTR
jgi:hypothetical protein